MPAQKKQVLPAAVAPVPVAQPQLQSVAAAEPAPAVVTQPQVVVTDAQATQGVVATDSSAVATEAAATSPAKEKKKRVPHIVVDSSMSETRIRKCLSNTMTPEVVAAVDSLKTVYLAHEKGQPKMLDADNTKVKKLSDLSDDHVRLALKHKPEPADQAPAATPADGKQEKKEPRQSENAKRLEALRLELWNLLQTPRASWPDRTLSDDDRKVLRRMIKQDCIRIGEDAIDVTTAHANFIVRELAKHGIASAKAENKPKRVLKLHHITNDGITQLSIWPFLSNLKCVADARAAFAQRVVDQAAKSAEKKEKQKKKKAEAKAAKEAAAANPAPAADASVAQSADQSAAASSAAQPPAPAVEVKTTPESAESAQSAGSSAAPEAESKEAKQPKEKRVKTPEADFEHHSQNIIREVIQEQDGKFEISSDVKSFCARAVYEMLCMYGSLIQNQTAYAGVKTIKSSTINSVTQFILAYSRVQCAGLMGYVESWLKKEADKKASAKAEKGKPASSESTASAVPEPVAVVVGA